MNMPSALTPEQTRQFHQDGFLALPGFKTAAQMAALCARAEELVDAFDPASSRTIFTTNEQVRAVDRYFLDSATQSRCFFEEEAFDAEGNLRQAKALSINKIGHAMHDLDPVFDAFSRGAALDGLARGLGLEQPQLWQSMYIFKQPGIGGEVGWHQDATFFDSTPISVTTFWFALEVPPWTTAACGCSPVATAAPCASALCVWATWSPWRSWMPHPGPTATPPCRWR
jgi:phytanoyl-CoA hydroxylase